MSSTDRADAEAPDTDALDTDAPDTDAPDTDAPDTDPSPSSRRGRMVLRRLAWVVGTLAAAVGCVALSLYLTPMQSVSAAGQTVEVGVTAPSWSLSGPGELDLFGQTIPTTILFAGPVRPRLALSRISFSEQLAQLTNTSSDRSAKSLQDALVDGFHNFFYWQLVVAAGIAVVVFGAAAGWLRRGRRQTVALVGVGLVLALALDGGVIMVTAYSAPSKLASIRSLQDLVGSSPPAEVARTHQTTDDPLRRVVVVGDSTAAGLGLPPVTGATADDTACHRSADSFAEVLAQSTGGNVVNLACSGATIRNGLLGQQATGERVQPPQLASAAVNRADAIIVSIGANDLHWVDLLKLCAVSQSCSNNAEQAFLQQQLASFSTDLLELLSELQLLPNHPLVVVNQYYDPFAGNIGCLADKGLTAGKKEVLERDLEAMNAILASGAKAAGFTTTTPDFSGHGVCSVAPYVQGVTDPAPFHPTASGELAIALAVQQALQPEPRTTGR